MARPKNIIVGKSVSDGSGPSGESLRPIDPLARLRVLAGTIQRNIEILEEYEKRPPPYAKQREKDYYVGPINRIIVSGNEVAVAGHELLESRVDGLRQKRQAKAEQREAYWKALSQSRRLEQRAKHQAKLQEGAAGGTVDVTKPAGGMEKKRKGVGNGE